MPRAHIEGESARSPSRPRSAGSSRACSGSMTARRETRTSVPSRWRNSAPHAARPGMPVPRRQAPAQLDEGDALPLPRGGRHEVVEVGDLWRRERYGGACRRGTGIPGRAAWGALFLQRDGTEVRVSLRAVIEPEHALDDPAERGRDGDRADSPSICALGIGVALESHSERGAHRTSRARQDNLALGLIRLDDLQAMVRGERPDRGDVGGVRAAAGAQLLAGQVATVSEVRRERRRPRRRRGRHTGSDPNRDLDELIRVELADELCSGQLPASAAGDLDARLLGWHDGFPPPCVATMRRPLCPRYGAGCYPVRDPASSGASARPARDDAPTGGYTPLP